MAQKWSCYCHRCCIWNTAFINWMRFCDILSSGIWIICCPQCNATLDKKRTPPISQYMPSFI